MALLFLRSRSRLSWKSSRFIYSVCLKFVRSRMVFLRLSCQIANSRYFWGISDFHIIRWFRVVFRCPAGSTGSAVPAGSSVDIARASGGCGATSRSNRALTAVGGLGCPASITLGTMHTTPKKPHIYRQNSACARLHIMHKTYKGAFLLSNK